MSGKLYIVATPLGNLDDFSPRAVATLRGVDRIACEDTRRTAKLLAHYQISVPTISYHRFNEMERLDSILDSISAGERIAVVSDGGTPGLSDPGKLLVKAALDREIEIVPIPGPSAVVTLLSCSGLPADRYVFEGFLPHRGGERRRKLRELRRERRTVVFFESPHRILETLHDVGDVLGDRLLVIGRELTKLHETLLRGSAGELAEKLGPAPRGEFTIALAGADDASTVEPLEAGSRKLIECWEQALAETAGDRRSALRKAARSLGLKKAELYRALLELGVKPDRPGSKRDS